jgi:cytochrome c oxidase assembly protein subunit 15
MNDQNLTWQFSLQAVQGLAWLAVLAVVFFAGMRVNLAKLVGLTAFLTLDLIMFGAFVRLSDSGLGCPDWPGCYGQFTPLAAKDQIAAAVAAQGGEHGWVSNTKAWIEMIHRYWATFIGVLIIVIVARVFVDRRRGVQIQHSQRQPMSLALPLFVLATVIMQGLFGKWTVTYKLMPWVVTAHLLGGMLLFSLLVWLALRHTYGLARVGVAPALRMWAVASIAMVVLQIALGGWVSTNYAALACSDAFPLCQGSAWPAMDFANGFDLSRNMGQADGGTIISLQALTAIHFVHRTLAYVVLGVVGLFAWRLTQQTALKPWGIALAAALVLQVLIGIGTVVFNQPLLLAVAHSGGAALLLGTLIACAYKIQVNSVSAAHAAQQPHATLHHGSRSTSA